jgi:HD-GYP domain-containing protein (c-di-GMP phosphodiesterase class II)
MSTASAHHDGAPALDRIFDAIQGGSTLTARLQKLHDRLLESVPCVDRIACALYDAKDDVLRTFINSTRAGEAITGYEFRLSDSRSLTELARTGEFRVLDDIPKLIKPDTRHSQWLMDQGYRSSFTVPLYHNGLFIGLVFYDSTKAAAFTETVQRDLVLYSNLINMAISGELSAVHSIISSARIARDFANMRDFETGEHLERMARFARLIARNIAPLRGLSDEFVEHIGRFAPLHDIGKIGIPDRILLKAGRLDADERTIMETHVEKGVAIIEKIIGDFGLYQLPEASILLNIVRCHHEYLDGSGYPAGLRDEDIPIEARIVTVADIFDALTCIRPYKKPWEQRDALDELQRMSAAGQLDPDCVAALMQNVDELADINRRFHDA